MSYLITIPGTDVAAIPDDADPQYKGASAWWDNTSYRGGSRKAWWMPTASIGPFLKFAFGRTRTIACQWGSITRIVPMESPIISGEWAVRFNVELGGNSFTGDLYSGAWVTLDFENPQYGTAPGPSATPYMVVRRAQSAEAITIPGRFVRLPDGTKLNQDATVAIPGMAYLVTCYQVPAVNDAAVQAALAAPVNSATLYLNEMQIAAGHAFFEGLEDETAYLIGGTLTRTVTYRFRFRQRLTYNQIISPIDGTIVQPVYPDGGPPYGTSDLNGLFA